MDAKAKAGGLSHFLEKTSDLVHQADAQNQTKELLNQVTTLTAAKVEGAINDLAKVSATKKNEGKVEKFIDSVSN